MKPLIPLFLFALVIIFSLPVSSQPVDFLGDVAKLSPLDCATRQCASAGIECAKNCPESFNALTCSASCSKVYDLCLKSRCLFAMRDLTDAQEECCRDNKFGCVYDSSQGCINSLRQPCERNKGFNESFLPCVNNNINTARGNISANLSRLGVTKLDTAGLPTCFDNFDCSSQSVCYQGNCVPLSNITPFLRRQVGCLDDSDCPTSNTATFLCLNSTCLIRPPFFCRTTKDCLDGTCVNRTCALPEHIPDVAPPPPVDPAVAALQDWAKSRSGLVARIIGVSGSPTDKKAIYPSPGRYLAQSDGLESPQGMAVELQLADGSALFAGTGSKLLFNSFKAEGKEISYDITLVDGESVFNVLPLVESRRALIVKLAGHQVSLAPGIFSIVSYPEKALKIAARKGTATLDSTELKEGFQIVIDPSGSVWPQEKIPPEEAKRIDAASQAPVVSNPPAIVKKTLIERFGSYLIWAAVLIIILLWAFSRHRRAKPAVFQSTSKGIKWEGK